MMLEKINIKYLIWAFVMLTAGMIVTSSGFYIDEVIASPQFKNFHVFGEIVDVIHVDDEIHHNLLWYRLFFFVDFIWALAGLMLLFRWMESMRRGNARLRLAFKWFRISYGIVAILPRRGSI
jgi:uncharacterized membrane protein